MISNILNKVLASNAKILNKLASVFLSTNSALYRIKSHRINIETIIDVGASNGSWTIKAKKVFPCAAGFLIEAQNEHEKALKKLKSQKPEINYIIAAASNHNGYVYFDDSALFGGVASENANSENDKKIPAKSIDAIVNQYNLKPPFLLKLDTHGYELPILEGSVGSLKNTEIIIIETYNFNITKDNLKFYEMCKYLETLGFRCIDMSAPMFRTRDLAFWQIDLFFIKSDNPLFNYNEYE